MNINNNQMKARKNKRTLSSFKDFKKAKDVLQTPKTHSIKESENNAYMFWQNLKTMKHAIEDLLSMDKSKVESLLNNGHGWALDHIATSMDDVEEVYHFVDSNLDDEREERIDEE